MQTDRVAVSWFFLLTFLAAPAYSLDAECRLGKDASIPTGECANQLNNHFDVELNEKYQEILRVLKRASEQKPNFARAREQLIASQRNWIKFRDSDCRALASFLPGDPSIQSKHSVCLMERTKQRVKELDTWVGLLPQPARQVSSFSVVESGKPVAGQPLSLWIQRYWQWQRSFPPGSQPSNDNTGTKCGIRQNQAVFFLSGSASSIPVSRNCTIPGNKYVLIPIINVLAQNDGPGNINCNAYLHAVRQVNDSAIDLSLAVNGQSISLINSKADSGCFHLNDAARGVSGTAAGAGHWIVLEPLEPGDYLLHFSGRYLSDGFSQEVTYKIRVE